ncbi:hypothetical protein PENSOL_c148G02572 [Penicillium solitum]|uniref:Uncharacterized protein n=1 Tax=Penicillium solitum TaxID=60172 RepID=A0A1V6Q312_9EURO|nr:uncharacterized protein PENSOL_c148G02572 [Penicillium solitum]OQD83649.1 hypothetical protein PENSOL_c148G02572 [Penicillium solitum]
MEVLRGLNKGSETVMRCRDTLMRLITAFDFDAGFAPESFSLSPSSAWAWQFVNPGLFSSEASLSLAPGTVDIASGSQFPISTNIGVRPEHDNFHLPG